jgi:hypothetical protein
VSASPANPRETVARFLAAVVSPTPGDMADCYADRVIIEMPFAAAPVRVMGGVPGWARTRSAD